VSYEKLVAHYRQIHHLSHVSELLGWDSAVCMPTRSGDARAEAIASLEGMRHAMAIEPRVAEWIAAVRPDALDATERANLREIERCYARATALPPTLVSAQSRARVRCEVAWRGQRKASDFEGHRPLLEEVVRYEREEAQCLAERFGVSPYDALLDRFEPGLKSALLDTLFGELESILPDLVEAVLAEQSGSVAHTPPGPFPSEQQRTFSVELMAKLGFDFEHGRLDVSHHPFCTGMPDDVRITTRYNEDNFVESLMSVLHETGHAKYEQGLPRRLRGLPVGEARSMGVHESQSLFLEMFVCRRLSFFAFAAPIARRVFAEQARRAPEAFSAENLTRLCTRVARTAIRVDADEVTYPLHVMFRYRIERALIEGTLQVRDLPEHWDIAMRRWLGLSSGNNHRDGCMQDVHWGGGLFGYFPSYVLGAFMAAQLFEAAEASIGDLDQRIALGDFAALDAFLHDRIWSKASLLETDALLLHATGKPLGTRPFVRHLRRRYLGVV
jgi:carboxypeptidase Taq